MHGLVSKTGHVSLAVGNVFEDCRYRILLRIFGQPKPCGEFDAIGHGDPDILDIPDPARAGRFRTGRTRKPERQCARVERKRACAYSADEVTTVYRIARFFLISHVRVARKCFCPVLSVR